MLLPEEGDGGRLLCPRLSLDRRPVGLVELVDPVERDPEPLRERGRLSLPLPRSDRDTTRSISLLTDAELGQPTPLLEERVVEPVAGLAGLARA
jgi:hypothetical protein